MEVTDGAAVTVSDRTSAEARVADRTAVSLTDKTGAAGGTEVGVTVSEKEAADSDGGPCRHGLPVDEGWSWVIMAGHFVLTLVMLGYTRALSIFLMEFVVMFEAPVATAMLCFSLMTAGFALGNLLVTQVLLPRFDTRHMIVTGTAVGSLAIALCAFTPNITVIILAHSVIGFCNAMMHTSSSTLMGPYFHARRGLANAVANTGVSVSALVYPPLTQFFITSYGTRGALLLVGGIQVQAVVAACLMRSVEFYEKKDRELVSGKRKSPSMRRAGRETARPEELCSKRSLIEGGLERDGAHEELCSKRSLIEGCLERDGAHEELCSDRSLIEGGLERDGMHEELCSDRSLIEGGLERDGAHEELCSDRSLIEGGLERDGAHEEFCCKRSLIKGSLERDGVHEELCSDRSLIKGGLECDGAHEELCSKWSLIEGGLERDGMHEELCSDRSLTEGGLERDGMHEEHCSKRSLTEGDFERDGVHEELCSEGGLERDGVNQDSSSALLPRKQRCFSAQRLDRKRQCFHSVKPEPLAKSVALSRAQPEEVCSERSLFQLHTSGTIYVQQDERMSNDHVQKFSDDRGGQASVDFSTTPCLESFVDHSQTVKSSNGDKRGAGCASLVSKVVDLTLLRNWLFLLVVTYVPLGLTNAFLGVFLPSLGVEVGLSRPDAALLLPIMGGVDLFSRLVLGYLADTGLVRRTRIVAVALAILSAACMFASFYRDFGGLVVFCVLFGLCGGTCQNLLLVVIIDLLGLDNLGKALGLVMMVNSICLSLAHPLLGAMVDWTGSYVVTYHYVGVCLALAALILLMEPLARKLENRRLRRRETSTDGTEALG